MTKDCIGQEINVGDTIVYFVRDCCTMKSQKAKVEFIGAGAGSWNARPSIRVLREDAVEKDQFTRKAWLWSFNNSVRIG